MAGKRKVSFWGRFPTEIQDETMEFWQVSLTWLQNAQEVVGRLERSDLKRKPTAPSVKTSL